MADESQGRRDIVPSRAAQLGDLIAGLAGENPDVMRQLQEYYGHAPTSLLRERAPNWLDPRRMPLTKGEG